MHVDHACIFEMSLIPIEIAEACTNGDGHDLSKYHYLDWNHYFHLTCSTKLTTAYNSAILVKKQHLPDTSSNVSPSLFLLMPHHSFSNSFYR